MRPRLLPHIFRLASCLALCLAIGAAACASAPSRRHALPNVVLFLIDTLRADHVGAYGYERDTTPFVDAMAARGLLFESAVAQAPWTAPSMASIWTGKYPSEAGVHAIEDNHGIRGVGGLRATALRENEVTLASVLAGRGYDTFAVTNNVYASDRFGLLSGFARKTHDAGAAADEAVDAGVAALERHADPGRPFFLYVHLIDLHEPTRPPAPYGDRYPTLDGEPHAPRHFRWSFGRGRDLDTEAFARYRSHKLALYDGALRFVDDQIARFNAELERLDLSANTVIVIAADHGEEFWDHVPFEMEHNLDPRGVYGIGHGHSMSRELLHVPLVMSGPGVPVARISGQVRNLDIAPTVLGLAKIASSPLGMRGVDLISAFTARRLKPLIAFSEDTAYGAEQKSVQTQRRQYVRYQRARTSSTEFLFRKPAGMPVVAETAGCKRLRRVADRTVASVNAAHAIAVVPDAEALEEMRALGYSD